MALNFEFTLRGARVAATADLTEEWVDAFLTNSLHGANPYMAAGLRKQRRWWLGPLPLPLAALNRICGPEPEMKYRQSVEDWEAQISAIAAVPPDQLPPIIVEFQGDAFGLHDGSHRHEAVRRQGAERIWALMWCNTESDFTAARAKYAPPEC
jgi:hypothetical protein